jgi:1,4-alpha-glucan branching enzyme
MLYAFTENFILPLSHDEVVHGKASLLSKMPGDDWQMFANLRLLFAYQFSQPGKKLLFMGGEIGQWGEWQHDVSLDWHLLQHDRHRQLQRWVKDLNHCYQNESALHGIDFHGTGFEWVDCNDYDSSSLSFLRKGKAEKDMMLVVCNFTPVPRYYYRVGVPRGGFWKEILNSDAHEYGGSGQGNLGGRHADEISFHGRPFSLEITVPPLGAVFFKSPPH